MANVTFDKQLTALLVIDPSNDFVSKGGKIWKRFMMSSPTGSVVRYVQD